MIDLFAGAGGLTLGFHSAGVGFESVFAVEMDQAAANTFKVNFGGHVEDRPIEFIKSREFPEARVLVGGPPCQGFSPLGRDRDPVERAAMNELWRHYRRVVKQVQPEVFVIENVPEFVNSPQYRLFERSLRNDSVTRAYRIAYRVLNAADFGVPQRRKRGIVIGSRVGDPGDWWPTPTHGPLSPSGDPYATVRNAIGDLPLKPMGLGPRIDELGRQHLHFGRSPRPFSVERYKAVPEGGNRFDLARNRPDLLPACWARKPTGTTDVFGRLWWDRPAFTIRTEFFKPEKGRYLHPRAHRPITHREAARLQTFPDAFVFEGTKIEIARQIGNAVPVLLGRALALAIRPHLNAK
jgi:DNA (cytosine-5)-methyltransferase 1